MARYVCLAVFTALAIISIGYSLSSLAQVPAGPNFYKYYSDKDGKVKCGLYSARGNLVTESVGQHFCPRTTIRWHYEISPTGGVAKCGEFTDTDLLMRDVGDHHCDLSITYRKWYHYEGVVRCGLWARISHEEQYWIKEIGKYLCEQDAK
jgi:hypothetical protein